MPGIWTIILVPMVLDSFKTADAQLNNGGQSNATACAQLVRMLCASSPTTNRSACVQCVQSRSRQLVAGGCTSAHSAIIQTICSTSTNPTPRPIPAPPPAIPTGPPLTLVSVPGSHCSDGSPAGYYYSPPPNGSSTTWVIDLKGGGGCRFRSDCLQRAQTDLGSSLNWPANSTWQTLGRGYLSPDPQVNPDFYFSHKVYVPYCTGDAHAGNLRIANNKTWNLYFSGHANLEDFVSHLYATRGLASSTHVMFTGSSAGAIGVYRNANWLGSVLPHAFVAANPIDGFFFSGYFTGQPSWQPPPVYTAWLNGLSYAPSPPSNDSVTSVFNYSNNEYWIDAACAAAQGPGNESRCSTQTVLFPFITIPVFVSQRQFDSSMLSNLDSPSQPRPGTNSSVATYVSLVGGSVRQTLVELINGSSSSNKIIPDGLFSPSCYGHVGGLNWASYVISIGNYTSRQVVGDWFWQRNSIPHILRGANTSLPSNAFCRGSGNIQPPPPPPPYNGNATACALAVRTFCGSLMPTPTLCMRCVQNRSQLLVASGCDMTQRSLLVTACISTANPTISTVASTVPVTTTTAAPTLSDSSMAPTDSTAATTEAYAPTPSDLSFTNSPTVSPTASSSTSASTVPPDSTAATTEAYAPTPSDLAFTNSPTVPPTESSEALTDSTRTSTPVGRVNYTSSTSEPGSGDSSDTIVIVLAVIVCAVVIGTVVAIVLKYRGKQKHSDRAWSSPSSSQGSYVNPIYGSSSTPIASPATNDYEKADAYLHVTTAQQDPGSC